MFVKFSTFQENRRNFASFAKSRAFAVMTVTPVPAARSLVNRPLPICSKSNCAATGARIFLSLHPLFQIRRQDPASRIETSGAIVSLAAAGNYRCAKNINPGNG
jgi:hypothetical protein